MPCIFQQHCELPSLTRVIYKYGIILASAGVVLNWLGVARGYFEPVRYVGIALIIIGSAMIITAMCRWMYRPLERGSLTTELNSVNVDDLHVITVPLNIGAGPSRLQMPSAKPPEYCFTIDKPPSYDDAMSNQPSAVGAGGIARSEVPPTCVPYDQVAYYGPVHNRVPEQRSYIPSTPPPQYRSTEVIGNVCDSDSSDKCVEETEHSRENK